jgi:molybdopterin molybdotransferase
LTDFVRLPSERVGIDHALERVLSETIISSDDLPPFANSSMDGYAVRAEDVTHITVEQPVQLRVIEDIPAGVVPQHALSAGEAARIMTGAMLPPGADAIVPVEHTDSSWHSDAGAALPESVIIHKASRAGDYIRPAGEDVRRGEVVLAAGTGIGAIELGALAALGFADVPVVRRPRVAILTSGDELLAVDQPLEPGKIRDANSYALAATAELLGAQALRIPPARDTHDDVRRAFDQALSWGADMLVSTAGVSVGTADVVKSVVESMGELGFWRVNLRPGKPLAYGRVNGVPFFGLPGNPVSALVTFDVFVRPALLQLTGRSPDALNTIDAVLDEDISSDGRRTYARVQLTARDGAWYARLTGTQSSGALMSMVRADGLLIIPEGVLHAQAGERFPVRLLRS